MKKYNSKYAAKFGQRKSKGAIHYSMTVDSSGQATLNPRNFVYRTQGPLVKSFTRLRRIDELDLD